MAFSFVRSAALQERAERFLPGGVDSPVRAFRAVGGHPPFVVSAEGAWLTDADGNRYVDMFGSWGPMLIGPCVSAGGGGDPRGRRAECVVWREYGCGGGLSRAGAAVLTRVWRSCAFVSSGTEACMSAIRLARGFTGRPFVIKFEGCYHGHADALLVKAGQRRGDVWDSGKRGCPSGDGDAYAGAAVQRSGALWRRRLRRIEGQIACVILEPVVGNAGTIAPEPGYLAGLREVTRRHGALLIFDEVMTGFRLAAGGAQELFGFAKGEDAPDLTTLGKIVGGGLPVGVFGGKAEIMDYLAPLGPVYQAGTLSGNPLAMAAGIATLSEVLVGRAEIYPKLEKTTAAIADGVARIAAETGIALTTNRVGSMFTWFFTPNAVRDFAGASTSNTAAFGRFHRGMLERGVWLPPSQYEAAFVSAAHGGAEVEFVLEAARGALGGVIR